MYGLEKSVSLDFLLELKLMQVCIGEFQVSLNLEKDASISINDASAEFSSKDGKISRIIHADKPDETKELAALLGSTITGVANLGEGSVRLHFSNGASITLFDSNKEFESYEIWFEGKQEILV